MAFVISKSSTRKGEPKKLYYLAKNIRVGKKIKREILLNLYEYPTLAEFINFLEEEEKELLNKLTKYQNQLNDPVKKDGLSPAVLLGSSKYVKSRLEECRLKIQEAKQYLK